MGNAFNRFINSAKGGSFTLGQLNERSIQPQLRHPTELFVSSFSSNVRLISFVFNPKNLNLDKIRMQKTSN